MESALGTPALGALPATRSRSYTLHDRSGSISSHPFKALRELRSRLEASAPQPASRVKPAPSRRPDTSVDARDLIRLAKDVLDSSQSSLAGVTHALDLQYHGASSGSGGGASTATGASEVETSPELAWRERAGASPAWWPLRVRNRSPREIKIECERDSFVSQLLLPRSGCGDIAERVRRFAESLRRQLQRATARKRAQHSMEHRMSLQLASGQGTFAALDGASTVGGRSAGTAAGSEGPADPRAGNSVVRGGGGGGNGRPGTSLSISTPRGEDSEYERLRSVGASRLALLDPRPKTHGEEEIGSDSPLPGVFFSSPMESMGAEEVATVIKQYLSQLTRDLAVHPRFRACHEAAQSVAGKTREQMQGDLRQLRQDERDLERRARLQPSKGPSMGPGGKGSRSLFDVETVPLTASDMAALETRSEERRRRIGLLQDALRWLDVEEGVERYLFAHVYSDVLDWIGEENDPESEQAAKQAAQAAQRAARRGNRRRSAQVAGAGQGRGSKSYEQLGSRPRGGTQGASTGLGAGSPDVVRAAQIPRVESMRETDEALSKQEAQLAFVTLDLMEIEDLPSELEIALGLAHAVLRDIAEAVTASDKLQCIVNASKILTTVISEAGRLRREEAEKAGGKASSAKGVGADDLVPLFIHAVIHSQVPKLLTHLRFCDLFSGPDVLRSEKGYYLTTMQCALHFVRTADASSFKLDPVEFEQKCREAMAAKSVAAAEETAPKPSSSGEDSDLKAVVRAQRAAVPPDLAVALGLVTPEDALRETSSKGKTGASPQAVAAKGRDSPEGEGKEALQDSPGTPGGTLGEMHSPGATEQASAVAPAGGRRRASTMVSGSARVAGRRLAQWWQMYSASAAQGDDGGAMGAAAPSRSGGALARRRSSGAGRRVGQQALALVRRARAAGVAVPKAVRDGSLLELMVVDVGDTGVTSGSGSSAAERGGRTAAHDGGDSRIHTITEVEEEVEEGQEGQSKSEAGQSMAPSSEREAGQLLDRWVQMHGAGVSQPRARHGAGGNAASQAHQLAIARGTSTGALAMVGRRLVLAAMHGSLEAGLLGEWLPEDVLDGGSAGLDGKSDEGAQDWSSGAESADEDENEDDDDSQFGDIA